MKMIVFVVLVICLGVIWSVSAGHCCCNKKKRPRDLSRNKETIKKVYSDVAEKKGDCSFGGKSCACRANVSQELGYTREQLEELAEANLGLGCGSPAELAEIQVGQIVVDLGSGAGLDCFIVASKVGPTGKVVGIDVSSQMVALAQKNAEKYGYTNVSFLEGDIEKLPLTDGSADCMISNCVMSLASDKKQAFQEAWRVLKPGGVLFASDLVLSDELTLEQHNETWRAIRPGGKFFSPDLSLQQQRNYEKLQGTCALSAIPQEEYLALLKEVGFEVTVLEEDREINKKKFDDESLPLLSLHYKAYKKN